MNPSIHHHGVFLEIFSCGVLLIGKSGIGKSDTALELIRRQHKLIADDAVCFSRLSNNSLEGSCPPTLQNLLEIKGLGIINVATLFGQNAILEKKQLQLIIQLETFTTTQWQEIERLRPIFNPKKIMDLDIPCITLPVTPHRPLATIIECTVKLYPSYFKMRRDN